MRTINLDDFRQIYLHKVVSKKLRGSLPHCLSIFNIGFRKVAYGKLIPMQECSGLIVESDAFAMYVGADGRTYRGPREEHVANPTVSVDEREIAVDELISVVRTYLKSVCR